MTYLKDNLRKIDIIILVLIPKSLKYLKILSFQGCQKTWNLHFRLKNL